MLSLVSVLLEVSESGSSHVQRTPIECGVSECEHKASKMRRPRPTRAVKP